MRTLNVWVYRPVLAADLDLADRIISYGVEATDGHIGKVDEASKEAGRLYVVVDTGFWIFGKKRLIPVGVIDRIDHADKKIFVRMTKDEIKNAPDYDEAMTAADDAYYDKYSSYYGPFGS
jgi:hypothetical protein